MKFAIFRKDKNIVVAKDWEDWEGREEIALILVGLALLKEELLDKFEEMS